VDDQQAAAEARQLVQLSERIWWRLAELTWHKVNAGTDRAQWATDLGISYRTVNRWFQVWDRFGSVPAEQRPRYAEAWRMIASGHGGPASDAEPP
jgi:hypothetical protein